MEIHRIARDKQRFRDFFQGFLIPGVRWIHIYKIIVFRGRIEQYPVPNGSPKSVQ